MSHKSVLDVKCSTSLPPFLRIKLNNLWEIDDTMLWKTILTNCHIVNFVIEIKPNWFQEFLKPQRNGTISCLGEMSRQLHCCIALDIMDNALSDLDGGSIGLAAKQHSHAAQNMSVLQQIVPNSAFISRMNEYLNGTNNLQPKDEDEERLARKELSKLTKNLGWARKVAANASNKADWWVLKALDNQLTVSIAYGMHNFAVDVVKDDLPQFDKYTSCWAEMHLVRHLLGRFFRCVIGFRDIEIENFLSTSMLFVNYDKSLLFEQLDGNWKNAFEKISKNLL